MLIYSDTAPPSSCRDLLIEQLMREIVELMVRGTQGTYTEIMELKERTQDLEGQVQANYELIGSVRQQMEQVSVVIMTGGTAIIVYLIAAENRELEHYKEVVEQATSVSGTILVCVLWKLLCEGLLSHRPKHSIKPIHFFHTSSKQPLCSSLASRLHHNLSALCQL